MLSFSQQSVFHITGSIPLLVDYQSLRVSFSQQSVFLSLQYQSPRVSFSQQSVFLSLGQYNSWWTISPRCYHSPSSQCFHHWVNTTLGGLLVSEGIILSVVRVSITGSTPLLVDYQSPRLSFSQQSVFLSLGQHTLGGLLVPAGIILPVVSVYITGSIQLLVDYQSPRLSFSQQSVFLSLGQYNSWWTISPRGYHFPRVSFSQQLVFLSLGQHNSWWTISLRGYHSPSSQCFYHWVNTTLGGLLVPRRLSFSQQSVCLSLGQYHSWWIISPRWYHSPSSQCFYHWVNTTLGGGLLVPEGIILPVVSVSITGSIPLLVDYQSPRVSFSQQSVFLSLGQYHSWWIISSRGYHSPSSQCFHHWVNTTLGGLLVSEGIILPVVSVSITGSTPLLVDYWSPMLSFLPVVSVSITGSIQILVDYQSPMLSFSQQSVFLSLGQYHSWWIISPRGYHSPSSQCFYHWVNTTLGGLLVPEGIILPVVSVPITGSIPLLADYQSPRVSFSQQLVLPSLGQYHSWWIIGLRGYHSPSSQCFYHWVNTTLGGLLVPEGIILPVVSVSITGSIQLLVDYQSLRVSFSQQSVFLSLGQYNSWWIISPRCYHSPSSQCFYHWVNTTLGGLLVPEGIILPVVSVSITGSIPLLVDYQSPRVSFSLQSVFLSLGQYHSWLTISPGGYHSPSSQCFYHWVNTTLGGLLVPEDIILPVVSVSITGSIPLLVDYQSRRYHSPSSQCVYHWVNTTLGGLLVPEGIILPVVSVSITGSIPLLVDYQFPRVSFSQQLVFLSLGQYHSWRIISPRGYHSPSSQCCHHWVNTTLGGLLVSEGIILPVVSVSITGSIQLLVDYQSPRVSFSQQLVFLSLGQYHSWWIISPRGYHSPSSQCFHHWVNTTLGGLLVSEGIILPVVSVSITGSIQLLVDYQSPMLSFSQQSVFLSLGQYHSW